MMYPVTNTGYGTNVFASIWTHSGPEDFYRAAAAAAGNKPNSWPQCASLKSFYYTVICPAVWWAVTLWAMSPYRMLMNWNDKIIMCCWTHPYHVFFFSSFNWFSDAEWGREEKNHFNLSSSLCWICSSTSKTWRNCCCFFFFLSRLLFSSSNHFADGKKTTKKRHIYK